jgi:hypothetical protein
MGRLRCRVLIWLWLTSAAPLFGAQVNVEVAAAADGAA